MLLDKTTKNINFGPTPTRLSWILNQLKSFVGGTHYDKFQVKFVVTKSTYLDRALFSRREFGDASWFTKFLLHNLRNDESHIILGGNNLKAYTFSYRYIEIMK